MTPTTYIKYWEDDTNRYREMSGSFLFLPLFCLLVHQKYVFAHQISFNIIYLSLVIKSLLKCTNVNTTFSTHANCKKGWNKDQKFNPSIKRFGLSSSRFALSVFKDLKSVFHSIFVPTFFCLYFKETIENASKVRLVPLFGTSRFLWCL